MLQLVRQRHRVAGAHRELALALDFDARPAFQHIDELACERVIVPAGRFVAGLAVAHDIDVDAAPRRVRGGGVAIGQELARAVADLVGVGAVIVGGEARDAPRRRRPRLHRRVAAGDRAHLGRRRDLHHFEVGRELDLVVPVERGKMRAIAGAQRDRFAVFGDELHVALQYEDELEIEIVAVPAGLHVGLGDDADVLRAHQIAGGPAQPEIAILHESAKALLREIGFAEGRVVEALGDSRPLRRRHVRFRLHGRSYPGFVRVCRFEQRVRLMRNCLET